jgi:hypothetical protein
MRPSIISKDKASSHPLAPGRFYIGRVASVSASGQINVVIPDLETRHGPMFPVNATSPSQYSVGEPVVCTFTNEFFTELLVIGSMKVKTDSTAALAARVTALEVASTDALIARISALEEKVQALELGIWT